MSADVAIVIVFADADADADDIAPGLTALRSGVHVLAQAVPHHEQDGEPSGEEAHHRNEAQLGVEWFCDG
jgi:hypothetical protein